MGLRGKLLLGASLLVVFAMLIAVVFSNVVVNSLFNSAVFRPLSCLAGLEASRTGEKVRRVEGFLQNNAPFVEGKMAMGICPFSLLHTLADNDRNINSIYLLLGDADHLGKGCQSALAPRSLVYSWRREVGRGSAVGVLVRDPLSGKQVLPVFYSLGAGEGILVATVSFDWMARDAKLLPSFAEGMVVVDREGGVLFLPEGDVSKAGIKKIRSMITAGFGERGFKDSSVSLSVGDGEFDVFLKPVSSARLYVGTIARNGEVIESKKTIVTVFILVTLLALMVVALLTRAAVGSMIGRIEKMVRFADTISSGRYTVRLQECGNDELGQLCHVLNIMAQCLEDYERRYIEAQSRLQKMYKEKKEQAERDPLTGLYNHGKLYDFIETEIKRVNRYGGAMSVVIFDLNRFKEINDTYGHLVGDEALRLFAGVLRDNSRETDVVGRLGGDEFMAVLTGTGEDEALSFARRVCQGLKKRSLNVKGEEVVLDASFGIASYPCDQCEGETLLGCIRQLVDRADKNMYLHKKQARTQGDKVD